MRSILVVLILLPFVSFSQENTNTKPSNQEKTTGKATGNFRINGDIKGYPDNTPVSLLNGQSGASESETTIQKNKFSFTGSLPTPGFKIILINNQQPYITLFLDNSTVKISATKDNLDKAKITGSKTQSDYETFNKSLEPYKAVFEESAAYDSVAVSKAVLLCGEFALRHPNSYITPLAIIRFNQIAEDPVKTEMLYNALSAEVKASGMGTYISQYLADIKKNAIGTPLADFTQADTTGAPVSLSSFRGKYVLVDFWASWCGPCRQENPNVVEAYNKYKNRNFTILGVSLDKAKPAWVDAINADNLTWTHVSDLQGWSNSVAQQYQIVSIPQNFLLDPQGRVIAKNLRGNALDRKLARLLR